jgi:hypothetical protein
LGFFSHFLLLLRNHLVIRITFSVMKVEHKDAIRPFKYHNFVLLVFPGDISWISGQPTIFLLDPAKRYFQQKIS